MKISEMELLVRVAETGSMTLASQQLNLTPAAVSAAIQRIEAAIGVRLFERTTRSLHPTDEGLVVIEGCRTTTEMWQRTLDDARGQRAELQGAVHVSAPADTTYAVLEDVVVAMSHEHPKLQVVLETSDALLNLNRDALDMAIRYGPLQDSNLTVRKLAEAPNLLVAAPGYIETHGAPKTAEALAEHACLAPQLSGAPMTTWRLFDDGAPIELTVRSPLVGDGYLTRRWALAGVGIAFKSLFDVIDDLEAGRLVRVLPHLTGGPSPIHAVFPSRRFQTARVRAVHAAVAAAFAERASRCQAWLEGQA